MDSYKISSSKSLGVLFFSFPIFWGFISSAISSEKESAANPLGFKVASYYLPNGFSNNIKNNAVLCLSGYVPGTSPMFFKKVKREVKIESLHSYVIVRETVLADDVLLPTVLTFEQYREIQQREELERTWQDHVVKQFTAEAAKSKGTGGINLDIPVRIRSGAFQKIFGGSTVGLNVNGDIRIQAGLRREDRSEVRTAITRGANTNFKMQQIQRFTVTGKIGDKVTVNVDQDSERAFDFDNNVRLNYQGYDDEIIKKIEAGNISLSLPATQFVTFSGRNSGLFGIKTEMALGNLNVTTIASQEKGESQKLSLRGGAEESKQIIPDYRYLDQTYFFLDSLYREQYRHFDNDGNHVFGLVSPILRDSIEVYKAGTRYDTKFPDKSFQAWAVYDPANPPAPLIVKKGEVEVGHFIRLEKTEYYVENNLGFIRMNTRVADDEIIAVAYKTADGQTHGDFNVSLNDTSTKTIILKLIKPRNPIPSNRTWDLAWKHVYSLGGRNIEEEGLEIKIFFNPSAGPDQETDSQNRWWLEVFGLDKKDQFGNPGADGVIDMDNNILDLGRGEIHFPDLRPFDPIGIFVNGQSQPILLPDDKRTAVIYDTTESAQSVINAQSKFYLEVKSKNRSANYNLGFNVIEGSEVVTLNGEVLRRDVDYVIDYFSGTLTILDERATSPSANVDISYERNQLFQLEKKTILGARAEYNLGKDSFLGGTFLYLNESTLDRKVRVGRGPMRNMVWDINTRLNFSPNFIGNVFDALPFIRAKGETSLNFEGEIAQVVPTPNTLNNRKTGDNHGVAYIDDFEGSKKTVNLGIIRRNWTQASTPFNDPDHTIANMGHYIWYNPWRQVDVREIWPDREVNPSAGAPSRVHVLTLVLQPNTEQQITPLDLSWGGIMRALSAGFFDQTQTKFIEVWVQGNNGRLHIDLGLISEDVVPDNKLNTEDDVAGKFRDGILDPDEDVGLDGRAGPDPPHLNYPRSDVNAGFDFWDINRNGVKDPDEPWSYDNWFYADLSDNYNQINGTEGNANDEGGRYPDTEDINGNGALDLANEYFEYTFSLDKAHPDTAFIAGGRPEDPRGWVLYRIPIDSPTRVVGNPSLEQIEFVRLWVDGLTTRDSLSIAEINLVGNDWKELGITQNDLQLPTGADAANDSTVAVTVINTFDNPEYGLTLKDIGVEGEEDRITRVRAREQSLVLKATSLASGYTGIAQKSLFQGENYINYERIKMFVYGLDGFASQNHIADSTSHIEYFFRFGADVNNYYEFRAKVYSGWDDRNHMNLRLQDFTNIIDNDSTFYNDSTGTFIKPLGDGKYLSVKGRPSLTNVKTLLFGIRNLHPSQPFTGEIWFNELRLSEVQRDKGMAMRMRAQMKIADFASVNGEVNRQDADFHNVATRFGTGNNQLSGNFNANVSLDKVLPQSWGLSMPLSLNFRQSTSTPKYFPGQDREVSGDLPEEVLETIRTQTNQSGFSFSFRRQVQSKNFFLKHTLDKISFNLGKSVSHTENPITKFSDRRTWTGNFDYGIDFGKNNYFSPLAWLPSLPLIDKLKGTKFYYTPQNIALNVNGTKTDQRSQNRTLNANAEAAISETEIFNVSRTVRSTLKIFENLTVDINRTHTADMRRANLSDFFTGNFEDINVTQSFQTRYNPNIFSWLNNSFSYSSNYRFNNNIQQRTTGRSAGVNTNKSAQFTLRLAQFAKSLFGSGKERPDRRGRRPPRPDQEDNEGNQNEFRMFQGKEEKGKSFNPLRAFGNFLSKFKDISFNYSERKNINQFGLVPGTPSLAFQFGLSDTTNIATDSSLSTNNSTFSNNTTYSVGSGIAFGRAFDVNLRFQHSDQRNESTAISGNFSDSWLNFGNFDMPFPEWTVSISGLERLPLFSKMFKTVAFSHSFSGQRDITWRGTPEDKTQETITSNFRPLGKLDFNLKNGFSGNIQINRSRTLSKSLAGGIGANRTTNTDIAITANYSKRSGFRIPFWPFNKAELKNSIDFSFTFTASTVVTEQRRGQDEQTAKFDEQDRTERWAFTPKLTYSFSNRVRGGAFIEIGKTKSKRIGSTSIQEFGIDINVAIRGN